MCHLEIRSQKILFADDTTLYLAGSNLQKIICDIEEDLIRISEWLAHNRLILNINKSNAMIFKWRYQRKLDTLNTNLDAMPICKSNAIMREYRSSPNLHY